MPPDIRTFFGSKVGAGNAGSQEKSTSKKDNTNNTRKPKHTRNRKVVEDSEDDDYQQEPKKTTPRKAVPKFTKKESPKVEVTTTSDYFATNGRSKPTRSSPLRTRAPNPTINGKTPTPKSAVKEAPLQDPIPKESRKAKGRPARKKQSVTYAEHDRDPDDFVDSELDAADDVFAAEYKVKDDYEEDSDENDEEQEEKKVTPRKKIPVKKSRRPATSLPQVQTVSTKKSKAKSSPAKVVDSDGDIVMLDNNLVDKKPTRHSVPKSGKKRKSMDADIEENDDRKEKAPISANTPVKMPPAKKSRASAKKVEDPENEEMQAIFDSIPTIRPPSPPAASGAEKKFNFRDHAQQAAPNPTSSAKEIPNGAENCLAGLTFVFTGQLETMGRDEGIQLVKRYGGKVTGAPSRKTSYVILGEEAGPKKLETIRKLDIKTINEDGLLELIRKLPVNGGDSKAAEKNEENKKKEDEKMMAMAAEMDKQERLKNKAAAINNSAGKDPGLNGTITTQPTETTDDRLLTVKYAPTATSQICGNNAVVGRLQRWLQNWPKSQKKDFKWAGPDATGIFRAAIIYGPPGIGKTTAAHLVANLEGYDVLESNASDTRSKKLVETGLMGVLDNTSLMGHFARDNKKVDAGKSKLLLILDEVDGMSAGDRGGVGALAQLCKKTHIPLILICNDRKHPKMKPFDHITADMRFNRPTTDQIRSRMAMICFREGFKLPKNVLDALIEGTHADIRQIINMLSTIKLGEQTLDFDQGKSMSKAWEKHIVLKPWDIASKILGGGMFTSTSPYSLNDKIELYFNDHEKSSLMLQENYIKCLPNGSLNLSGRERTLKALELMDKAAESISDGDLVDRMIHGSQQHWSLMPAHAVFSFVRPASFAAGTLSGQGGISFTSWLGNNSKQGRLLRLVKEIQGHMRLRASGDRHETRQHYIPALWTQLVRKLQVVGKEAVPEVIDLMDSYFLTKDDWDAILELGLGPMDAESVKIDTQTKATFTRLYNQQSHPLPFMKASNVFAPKKSVKEKPDLEEALEESDEGEDPSTVRDDEDEEDMDITKDKYVKQPKKKAAPRNTAAKKSAASKKKQANSDEEMIDDEDQKVAEVKPKKPRAPRTKTSAAAKSRAKN
ncbi:MAG: hypothetical protein M1829_006631 [Trizodia sp. TS-e1964]|nr:MAG: hypothetical protein M1829_006631 [Trizodia sp. TS-e1964]